MRRLFLFALFLFVSAAPVIGRTLYVDDAAPGDPGPRDPSVSDPAEDGSSDHPFDRIQEALDASAPGHVIAVGAGDYFESLLVPNDGITIRGGGAGSTLLHIPTSNALTFAPHDDFPTWQITFSDLAFTGGNIRVCCAAGASFERVRFLGVSVNGAVTSTSGGGPYVLHDVEAAGGTFSFGGDRGFQVGVVRLNAPTTRLSVGGRDCGGFLDLTDSVVDSVFYGTGCGSAHITGVRFTGDGMRALNFGSQQVIVENSIFEHGGLTSEDNGISQGGTSITVSNSRFLGNGIEMSLGLAPYEPNGHDEGSILIDRNIFTEEGARISVNRTSGYPISFPAAFRLHVRAENNVFQGGGLEAVLDYEPPPATLNGTLLADLQVINNSIAEAPTGIFVGTGAHVTGKDHLSTALVNNIVAGGENGIWIDGTDDQTLAIRHNDVFGATTALYAGVTDRTGLDGNISVPPVIVGSEGKLGPGSPCIDVGEQGPLTPSLDREGGSRPVDGNGDGVALPDIGADEFGSRVTPPLTLHVDDDAPGDPWPGDPILSDPLEDGSAAHPFDRIQEALDAARPADTVEVASGDYVESPTFKSKSVTLSGAGPAFTRIHGSIGAAVPFDERWALAIQDLAVLDGGIGFVYGVEVSIDHVDLVRGSMTGLVLPIGFGQSWVIRDVSMTAGNLTAGGSGSIGFDIERLNAPDCTIDGAVSDGAFGIRVAESTIGAIRAAGLGGIVVDRVRFTGGGIQAGEKSFVQVQRSTFQDGGITTSNASCPGTDSDVLRVSHSTFANLGIRQDKLLCIGQNPTGGNEDVEITDNTFLRDSVRLTFARPGGIFNFGFQYFLNVRLENNLFAGSGLEIGTEYDAGCCDKEALLADFRAVNNTLADADTGIRIRTAPHLAGRDSFQTSIVNNIVASGHRGVWIDGTTDQTLTILHNDVFGNDVANWVGIPSQKKLNGNIALNPRFLDAKAGVYRLERNSPCVDAGEAGGLTPATDHDGVTRPQDGNGDGIALPDIGAYERPAPAAAAARQAKRTGGYR